MKYFNSLYIIFSLLTNFWLKIRSAEGIVGGHLAKREQFKYFATVLTDSKVICGGGIISEQHVLTAAHCIIDNKNQFINEEFKVVCGLLNLKERNNNYVLENVESIYIPKEFERMDLENRISKIRDTGDIAVLKLRNGLMLKKNLFLGTLKLPELSNKQVLCEKQKAFVAGFGADKVIINNGKKVNDIWTDHNLRFLQTTVISNEKCSAMYKVPMTDKHICSQAVRSYSSTPAGVCIGDSGSPLVLENQTVLGILSSGVETCDERHYGGIYTEINSFIPFINQVINDEKTPDMRIAVYKQDKSAFGLLKKKMKLVEVYEFV